MSDVIEATCPECSRTKKVHRESLGRKVVCPCGNEFRLVYPAVKKADVDKSPAVEPRKTSKARKKSDVPIVRSFEIKKTRLGGYKAWYACPHCKAKLHSNESELQGRDQCPECNRPFRVSKDAIAEIDSCRERVRAEKERKKQEKKNQSNDKNMILIDAPPDIDSELIEPPIMLTPIRASRPTPPVQITVESSGTAHSLGISSLVLGVLSFFVCWIPIIGFAIGGLGMVLGGTGLILAISRKGSGIGYSIAGTALSSIAVLVGIGFMLILATVEDIEQQAMQQFDNELEDNQPQAILVPDQPVQPDAELQEKKPPLVVENWNWRNESGFAIAEGEVTNHSGQRLKNVEVVVSFYTEDNQFITSSNALVEYNPLLSGQTTPFKVIATHNPRMKSARLAFKQLFGGTISYKEK